MGGGVFAVVGRTGLKSQCWVAPWRVWKPSQHRLFSGVLCELVPSLVRALRTGEGQGGGFLADRPSHLTNRRGYVILNQENPTIPQPTPSPLTPTRCQPRAEEIP